MANNSEGPEYSKKDTDDPYRPSPAKKENPTITSAGLLDFTLQRLMVQTNRLEMNKQLKIYDISNAYRKRLIFGLPLNHESPAIRLVINEHIDNSVETYAGIFVDDMIVTRNGIACNMGYVPLDFETGDLPEDLDNLEHLPPVAWKSGAGEWNIFEGSEELIFPLPRHQVQEDDDITYQAKIAGCAAMALREISAAHDVNFL